MADIKALRSYLVSLGFSVNTAQAAQFNNAIQTAAQVVNTNTNNIAKNMAKWSVAIVGMFEAVGASVIALADKTAMADQEYRLFGQRMFMDASHAKTLKIALDALHLSMTQVAFDQESNRRFTELQQLQENRLAPMLGADFPQTMVQIRDMRMEFTKFQVEVLYFRDLLVKQIFQALGGETLTAKLREWNEYIIQHIPEWSRIITTYIVPVLKYAWEIMRDLWRVAVDFAQIFTNIVGFFSMDSSVTGTVNLEKFSHALQKVAHLLAFIIGLLSKFAGTIAGAGIGLALGGPMGALIGAGVGGAADLARSTFGQGGQDQGAATGAPTLAGTGSGDVRALAAHVGGNLGVDPGTIYAQWAHETGNFTNRGARQLNNLAGIRLPGSTEYRSFSSLSEFGDYYSRLIARRYPGAVGAQSINQFAGALKSGGYFEDSLSNYTRGMQGFSNAYHSGGGSNIQVGSINIMQPNASPEQIKKAVADGIQEHQNSTASANLAELRALYG